MSLFLWVAVSRWVSIKDEAEMCPAFLSSHTCVHAGEHETQGSHGTVWAGHVYTVNAQLDQRLRVHARQLLRQKQPLHPSQDAVVDDGWCGLLGSRQHHTAQLEM